MFLFDEDFEYNGKTLEQLKKDIEKKIYEVILAYAIAERNLLIALDDNLYDAESKFYLGKTLREVVESSRYTFEKWAIILGGDLKTKRDEYKNIFDEILANFKDAVKNGSK